MESSRDQNADAFDWQPDEFELIAQARNSYWRLDWNGRCLIYGGMLPPLSIRPEPGEKREEDIVPVESTVAQWSAFWQTVDEVGAWQWTGDYSAGKVLWGGTHWTFKLRKQDNSMECAGNNGPDEVPPGFIRLLEVIVQFTGSETSGPTYGPANLLRFLRMNQKSPG
jgi:hypothetical protein